MDPQPRQPQLPAQCAARDQVSRTLGAGPAARRAGGRAEAASEASGGAPPGLWRSWCRRAGPEGPSGSPWPLPAPWASGLRPCEALGTRKAYFGVISQGPEWLLISPPHSRPSLPSPHAQLLPGLGFHSGDKESQTRRADIPAGLGGGGGGGCQRHCPEGICLVQESLGRNKRCKEGASSVPWSFLGSWWGLVW